MKVEQLPGGGSWTSCIFLFTLLLAVSSLWLTPHLPMSDLPQHAAQISMLRDIIQGNFLWDDLARVNLATPYLLGYGISALLALFLPISHTIALVLSLTLLAYVGMLLLYRAEFKAPAKLDILIIPGFFGFAWHWGFYSFLVALPVGLAFGLYGLRYARNPTFDRAMMLLVFGIFLFFSHAMVFMFGCLLGGIFLLYYNLSIRRLLLLALPYALLGLLLALYVLFIAQGGLRIHLPFQMDEISTHSYRLIMLFHYTLANYPDEISAGLVLLAFTPLLYLNIWQPLRNAVAYMPVAIFTVIWLALPHIAVSTAFIYQRFSMLFLPFFQLTLSEDKFRQPDGLQKLMLVTVHLAALLMVSLHTYRVWEFDQEAKDYQIVSAQLEPRQRVIALVAAHGSNVTGNPTAYMHMPVWYQAEQQGWTDFNFAIYHPQIIAFRPHEGWSVDAELSWMQKPFDWIENEGHNYRYFFVRTFSARRLDEIKKTLTNPYCPISLKVHSGSWYVFERGECTVKQPDPSRLRGRTTPAPAAPPAPDTAR